MHTHTRLTIVAVCLVVSAPSVLLVARLDRTDRTETQQTLQRVIALAATEYRSGMSVQMTGDQAKIEMRAESRHLSRLRQRQLAVRQRLGHLRAAAGTLLTRYGTDALLSGSGASLREQKRALEGVMEAVGSWDVGTAVRQSVTRALLGTESVRDTELLAAAARELRTVYDARFQREMLAKSLTEAEAERHALQQEIAIAEARYDSASKTYARSVAALDDIKATVIEVRAQIFALQSELSNIDDKLRRTAARALIEKGLLEPGELPPLRASAPVFGWPVTGRVTAGFREESYADHFGIPHDAIDIAAEQGTPVVAAADGIVFVARDGGQFGYSYLLIGHQGGFATLYGHLSAFTVAAGDQVTAGQVVGLSGGTPGTYGAGSMTTGPHLHFELIQDGAHIDPQVVLP